MVTGSPFGGGLRGGYRCYVRNGELGFTGRVVYGGHNIASVSSYYRDCGCSPLGHMPIEMGFRGKCHRRSFGLWVGDRPGK